MPGNMSWLPQEKRRLKKPYVEVVKRRRDGCVGYGPNPSGVQNREDSGAGLKKAVYGRHCMPLGKSGNLQRFLLRRPSQRKKRRASEMGEVHPAYKTEKTAALG